MGEKTGKPAKEMTGRNVSDSRRKDKEAGMTDIDMELYKVFYHVARTLSFSEASRALFISQSAVSQSVKTLEKKLNCRLFARSTKKVQLTPEGEILFRHIEPAINLIRQGEKKMLEAEGQGYGQLRIGASDTICRYFLVPYLEAFHKLYPRYSIKVTNQTSIECARMLDAGTVDLSLINYPNSALSGRHRLRTLKTFRDVFVANPDYFPLAGKCLSLQELLQYPILMLDGKSTTGEFLHSRFRQANLELVPEIELSSNDLLIDLARIGLGIAFVPDFCIPADGRDLFCLQLAEELPARHIAAAYNESVPVPEAALCFLKLLSKEKTERAE